MIENDIFPIKEQYKVMFQSPSLLQLQKFKGIATLTGRQSNFSEGWKELGLDFFFRIKGEWAWERKEGDSEFVSQYCFVCACVCVCEVEKKNNTVVP